MRYQLTAEFHGETWILHPYEIQRGDYAVRLGVNSDNIVNEICVSRRVVDYAPYLPDVTLDSSIPHVCFPVNPYFEDLVSLLQYIESVGSYWCGIMRIDWDSSRVEWVPETEAERLQLKAFEIQVQRSYDSTPDELPPALLGSILGNREKLKDLTIPLAFYREGRNEFRSFRYMYAFMNFYLFLEGLFGQGKTKNHHIEQQLKSSPELRSSVGKILDGFLAGEDPEHSSKVSELCRTEQCDFSVDGIIELLVRARGNLFHYSMHSSKRKGHPLNQREFETLAFLTMGICLFVLAQVFPTWPNLGRRPPEV